MQTTIIGYPETLQALPQAERRAITNALDTAANITNPAERQAPNRRSCPARVVPEMHPGRRR